MHLIINFSLYILLFGPVSQIAGDVVCGPGDINIPNPVDCNSYYRCANGVPILSNCAPSIPPLVFSPIFSVCVWPYQYDCRTSTTAEPTTKTTAGSTSAPTSGSTSEHATTHVLCRPEDEYLPNPVDCNSFYQCTNGLPKLMNCASPLVFHPILNVCVSSQDYDCETSTTAEYTPETSSESTTSSSEITVETSSDPTTETSTKPTTELPLEPTTECSSVPTPESSSEATTESSSEPTTTESTTEATTESSTKPTTESSTKPTTESSTEPTTESSTEPTTESSTEPTTESSTEPTTESSTEPTTESSSEPTTDCRVVCGPDDDFLSNPADCGSFYRCVHGTPVLFECAPTMPGTPPLVFNPILNICVWAHEYDCDISTTEVSSSEPTTSFSEPTTSFTEPTTSFSEPTTSFTEPTTSFTEPTTSFTEPTTSFTEPTTSFTEPTTSFTEPTTSFTEPTTSFTEPTTSFTEPTTSFTEPTTSFTEPTTSFTEPTTSFTEPTTSFTEPTTSFTEPTTSFTEPTTSFTEPTTSFTEPTTSFTEPTTSFSEPTTESSTEPTTDCRVVCGPDDDFLSNPADCGSFYRCVHGTPVLFECAPTIPGTPPLVFNPILNICVWAYEYDCDISATTEPTPESSSEYTTESSPEPSTESTLTPTIDCGVVCGPEDDFLSNPADCGSFYRCVHGTPVLFECAPTMPGTPPLVFNPILNECVWPDEYECPPPETAHLCHEYSHPTTCLSSPHRCSFCYDPCFRENEDLPRCDTYGNLLRAGCKTFSFDESLYDTVVETNTNCTTWLPIEEGKKRNISVTFRLEKHPLDLYYLMDFSGSMDDDKENLVSLSSALLGTLANLTNDFHIGFGTFVDKPILPFGVPTDYSFRNDLPLSSETTDFVTKISRIPILNGYDLPESHGDALSQVIECPEQIGWRETARRVVLLATDIYFHVAGDGIQAGITAPYVDGCYLDSNGYYSEELTMDYPSIEQLAKAYSKAQATTTVIFAADAGSRAFYENVASQFKSAYVGVLASDSSNVLQLLKEEFAKIEARMDIEKSETSDTVRFRYYSSCMNPEGEEETAFCEHLPSSGEVTFIVEIDLSKCPVDSDEAGMVFTLNPVGLPVFVDVILSYICP